MYDKLVTCAAKSFQLLRLPDPLISLWTPLGVVRGRGTAPDPLSIFPMPAGCSFFQKLVIWIKARMCLLIKTNNKSFKKAIGQ